MPLAMPSEMADVASPKNEVSGGCVPGQHRRLPHHECAHRQPDDEPALGLGAQSSSAAIYIAYTQAIYSCTYAVYKVVEGHQPLHIGFFLRIHLGVCRRRPPRGLCRLQGIQQQRSSGRHRCSGCCDATAPSLPSPFHHLLLFHIHEKRNGARCGSCTGSCSRVWGSTCRDALMAVRPTVSAPTSQTPAAHAAPGTLPSGVADIEPV